MTQELQLKKPLLTLSKSKKVSPKYFYLGIAILFLAVAAAASVLSHLPGEKKRLTKPKGSGTTEPIALERTNLISDGDTKVILERNIFNSEGKLGDWEPVDPNAEPNTITSEIIESKLSLKVKGMIFAGDPLHGLAYIENANNREISSFVPGNDIYGMAKLLKVYGDRIIIDHNGQKEYIMKEAYEVSRSSRKKKGGSTRASTSTRITSAPPPDTFKEEGFERSGLNISLTKPYLNNLLTDLSKILQDAKAEPNMVNNELKGFVLTRIRENSIYEKAGFRNGDIISEINGYPLNDPAGAIRLLQQLRNQSEVDVVLTRNGSTQDMRIKIQ